MESDLPNLKAYNVAGGVTSQTYPSGRTIAYTYDSVGRTASFTGNLGDGTNRTYATGTTYSPFGGISREQFGTTTTTYRKSFYNIRGQLFDTRASSVNDMWDWNRGRLINYYSSNHLWGQSGTDNNGNVLFAENWIPPENATLDQADTLTEDSYTYDSLNRLSAVAEQRMSVAGGWGTWQQQFQQSYIYDRWGNRTINPASFGTGINEKQFSVDTATNRLGVPVGQLGSMTYDNAGNLTGDTYSGNGTRTYDAENRMLTAQDTTGQTSRYTYDAEGNRVRRQVASSQEEWQIYGMDNELVAEYRASSAASAPEKEYGYRNGQLLITATGRFNVALVSNGAVATASSTATGSGFSTTYAINGNYRGPWGNSVEGWNDNTPNVVPDWIQVDFAGSKTIDEISVFSLHDNYTVENTPTETQTFTLYGLQAFTVQYWNGSAWTTITNGNVTGNNKVWRKFTFSPITTSKIRVTINQVPDSWSRVVEIQAFGTSAGGEKVQWLVADHLGTPRIVLDQTGSLAGVKRHDYLPFGEELFAGTGGRTVAQGYAGDGVRQQFTSKERDTETGLDFFGARYYTALQGRFTGPDPYDINLERQETADREDADALFRSYVSEPRHWNRYTYALNNPLRYIDPDGRFEKDMELLGKKIKVKISDDIKKKNPELFNKILSNIEKALDKINATQGLSDKQKEAIKSLKGIEVNSSFKEPGLHPMTSVYMITPRLASTDDLDNLAAGIVHDAHHADQQRRGVKFVGLEAEKDASASTVPIIKLMGLSQQTIKNYEYDAANGHGDWGPGPSKSKPPKKKKP